MPRIPDTSTIVSVSTRSIIKVIVILLLLGFLYFVRDIILLLFIAMVLASLIDPLVDWLQVRKIPRSVSVLLLYVLLIGLFTLVSVLLVPLIVFETKNLIANFGQYWERIVASYESFRSFSSELGILNELQQGLAGLEPGFAKTVSGLFSTLTNFFGGLFSFFIVLVIAFYIVVQEDDLRKSFRFLAPAEYQPYIVQLVHKMKVKLGAWLRGQITLSVFVGLLVYVGLSILGVQYALVLAIFAGLMEIIPYIGPTIAAVPAVFLSFTQTPGSLVKPLSVVIVFVVIQIVENNILVPKVMQRAIGMNPIVSIISILIGAKVAGIIGVFLAIPVVTAVSVFMDDVFSKQKGET